MKKFIYFAFSLLINVFADYRTRQLEITETYEYNFKYNIKFNETPNPDFGFGDAYRIMNSDHRGMYTSFFLDQLKDVHFWYGDTKYTYWSENHMIMYTAYGYLFQERFGNVFKTDEQMYNRLLWFLRVKQITEYYEIMSPAYIPFTFTALLDLYDYSQDTLIQEESRKALLTLLRQITRHLDSSGKGHAISGRYVGGNSWFFPGLAYLLLGIGNFSEIRFINPVIALALSNFDASILEKEYSPILYDTFTFGVSKEKLISLSKPLTKEDRITHQMSMGGYISKDYFIDTFHNVNEYNFWNSSYFKPYQILKYVPNFIYHFLAFLINTRGESSLLYSEHEKLYRYKSVLLNTINDYYPGYGGAQQMVFMASVEGIPVYTISGALRKSEQVLNNDLPLVKQKQHVALIVYNRNWDLLFTGLDQKYVYFHFDPGDFETVVEHNNWIFGQIGKGYIGIYRHCISEYINGTSFCYGTQQVWITVVGHEETHRSFNEFIISIKYSNINIKTKRGCIHANVLINSQHVEVEFCRQMGNVFKTIYILIEMVLFIILLFFRKIGGI